VADNKLTFRPFEKLLGAEKKDPVFKKLIDQQAKSDKERFDKLQKTGTYYHDDREQLSAFAKLVSAETKLSLHLAQVYAQKYMRGETVPFDHREKVAKVARTMGVRFGSETAGPRRYTRDLPTHYGEAKAELSELAAEIKKCSDLDLMNAQRVADRYLRGSDLNGTERNLATTAAANLRRNAR
jgi:hypothetical protein